jgi:hypothetical protein
MGKGINQNAQGKRKVRNRKEYKEVKIEEIFNVLLCFDLFVSKFPCA